MASVYLVLYSFIQLIIVSHWGSSHGSYDEGLDAVRETRGEENEKEENKEIIK